jgi:adenylate kinase
MKKTVILIIGTPSIGKTTIARELTKKLSACYINLSSLVYTYNLSQGYDETRKTSIIDEKKTRKKIKEIIISTKTSNIIIDGHYAASVVPEEYVTKAFVLRRNPIELKKLMEKRHFHGNKLWENLESEILDVCLIDTLSELEENKVCEIDITSKAVKEIINHILSIISNKKECQIGKIDWLKMLETKGIIDDYLKK